MKKYLLAALIVPYLFTYSFAQQVELIFGSLGCDHTGTIFADTSQTIDVGIWIRVSENIELIALSISLSTNDQYILSESRIGGELGPYLQSWDDVVFLDPIPDPVYGGYTNQTLLAICSSLYYCANPIYHHNEWTYLASFNMTTVNDAPTETPFCDAFINGYSLDWGSSIFVDFDLGEIEQSQISIEFSCLQFRHLCGNYAVGDFNDNGIFNVADIAEAFDSYFHGNPCPPYLCECPAGSHVLWPVAADVNNDCVFNYSDIWDGYNWLKLDQPEPVPCGQCPPTGP